MAISPSRRSGVDPFLAMDVLAEANRLKAAGHPVISMAVGQPSDPAPAIVRDVARAAVESGDIGYTDALGRAELRRAIALHYGEHYDVEVDPGRIAVTTGSSAGFNLAFLALFDRGARVAIARPGYPAYRAVLALNGIETVEIPVGTDGTLTRAYVEAAHRRRRLDGVLTANPANPTGASLDRDAFGELVGFCRDNAITLISDEIYHRLTYGDGEATALRFGDDATVINSFSKYYCMTGWRIGWMVLPPALVRPVERIQQNLFISAPDISQRAATAAFSATAELDAVKERYRRNRELLAQALPAMGLPFAAPMDGAFYAWCDISRFSTDSMGFARRMLDEIHVAATPGLDFDPVDGSHLMRFSYAGTTDDMRDAIDRIRSWLHG
jgi:aspartate/methionine/tyrosine aminotransferase